MLVLLVIELEAATQDRNSDRISKDEWIIEKLVGGAACSDAESGAAGAAILHGSSLRRDSALGPRRLASLARSIVSMTWIVWALLSALFAAATAILAKIGVANVDSNLATAIRTTIVVVFAWSIALALGKHGEIRHVEPRTWLFLALSGLGTGLSWLCYFRALQLGPASRVAPLDKLSVVLVMIFAAVFLGEKLTPAALIGGGLIAAGAVVMVLA